MDDDEDEFSTTLAPVKARTIDYLTALFIFLNDVAEAFDGLTNMLVTITARHANYKNEQSKFAEAIRAEIENLPTKE